MKLTLASQRSPRTVMLVCCVLFCLFPAVSQRANSQDEVIQFYRDAGIQPLINSEQEGDLSPGTYLVPHDIMIPKGKVMTIFPGTKILFIQNAMLVVNGTLVCSGTGESPVMFRKLDNADYFQPIDPRIETRWDGIYLPDSARLKMSNTIISDSKYGIVVSGKDVSMTFDAVRFVNNKFQNVKIGDRIMKISENSPVIFHYPEQQGVFVEPATVQNATETIQQKRRSMHETAYPQLRIGMGIAGGVGLVMAASGVAVFRKYTTLYENNPNEKHYRTYLNTGRGAAVGGAILFGAGAVGFTWTFFY